MILNFYNSKSNFDATNEITFNTKILKSNLCNYNNAYILMFTLT